MKYVYFWTRSIFVIKNALMTEFFWLNYVTYRWRERWWKRLKTEKTYSSPIKWRLYLITQPICRAIRQETGKLRMIWHRKWIYTQIVRLTAGHFVENEFRCATVRTWTYNVLSSPRFSFHLLHFFSQKKTWQNMSSRARKMLYTFSLKKKNCISNHR